MKYLVVALIMGLAFMAGLSCQETKTDSGPVTEPAGGAKQAAKDEPLLLEDEPLMLEDEPLLLDDEGADDMAVVGADNSRCHVCHVNYLDEDISVKHAKADMGCKDCHGESDEHIADESWASGGNGTAPDRMFPKDKINPFCMECHPKDKLKVPQHKKIIAGESEKVCTDCHGKHRLPSRKCKWK